jgi:hypothetical protein
MRLECEVQRKSLILRRAFRPVSKDEARREN